MLIYGVRLEPSKIENSKGQSQYRMKRKEMWRHTERQSNNGDTATSSNPQGWCRAIDESCLVDRICTV